MSFEPMNESSRESPAEFFQRLNAAMKNGVWATKVTTMSFAKHAEILGLSSWHLLSHRQELEALNLYAFEIGQREQQ